jgi:autotransporter-associated beta strand protein
MFMQHGSDLQNAQVTVTGGTSGGEGGSIILSGASDGGSASITMSGNATFDISYHDPGSVSVGSIAGQGSIFLGANRLSVGTNDQTTTFSGVIQDGGLNQGTGGSVTKVGTGTLTLSGANTYTGLTKVTKGALILENTIGSGTGTDNVTVQAGTLGGKGIIAGAVKIGTGSGAGAFLEPSIDASRPTTLTIQSVLTFKTDGTYTYKLTTKRARADQVIANGVTIESGAQFNFYTFANRKLDMGRVFIAISNTSVNPILGTFVNLPDDSTVTIGNNTFQADYQGGDGNDLTLTVVP